MDKEEIMADVEKIFCKILNKTSLDLKDETSAKDVDGWTSLTNMQIISEIEKHFNIQFTLREIIKMKTVGEFCSTIIKRIAA